jgi:pyrroloquinoline quinone biosynthesis protein B
VQVAVSSDDKSWFLLSASPDLHRQIEAFPKLQPNAPFRATPIAALVLPGGDLDQILGLILLREAQPLLVYATPSIRRIIMDHNIIFAMIGRQVTWEDMIPGEQIELRSVHGEPSGIRCLPFELSGQYPQYVNENLAASLPAEEALLGLSLTTPAGRRLIYMPGVPSVEKRWLERLEASDLLLFDGTFYTDDELIRIEGAARTARQMGHLPISGPDGSLQGLARLKGPRKIFIHINNTNPILDEGSDQYRRVRDAGWEVAHDGMEVDL